MASNQRKMTRRLRPTSGGMHDQLMSADQLPNNFSKSKEQAKQDEGSGRWRSRSVRRAAKKQIKTREDRAQKRGEF